MLYDITISIKNSSQGLLGGDAV